MSFQKILKDNKDKIVYAGLASPILLAFNIISPTQTFLSIQTKFFFVGFAGLSIYVFNKGYNKKKVLLRKPTVPLPTPFNVEPPVIQEVPVEQPIPVLQEEELKEKLQTQVPKKPSVFDEWNKIRKSK